MKTLAFIPLVLLTLLYACSNSTNGENPAPELVRWVTKSAEDDSVESGIDAIALSDNRNGIYLEWHPVLDEDLLAYDIFRNAGDSTGSFPLLASVGKKFGVIDTFFVDTLQVVPGVRYYYYIIARDEAGQVSDRSEKIDYKLVPQPVLGFPVNVQINGDFFFEWDFNAQFVPNSFVFRFWKDFFGNNQNVLTKLFTAGTDYQLSTHQEWNLAKLGLQSPLSTGMYRWRIDALGAEVNQGSESMEAAFSIQ